MYESVLFKTFTILVVIVTAVVAYFKWAHKYWERLGVPSIKTTIPFGTVPNLLFLKHSFGQVVAEQYKTAKSKGYKHVGLYGFARPEYMPIDLEILKHILTKDFNYFCDRGFYINVKEDPLSGHLFWLTGDTWKNLRAKLSPTFTAVKIRSMFNIIVECCYQLKQAIDSQHKQGPINAKYFLERFSTDVIGSCAFGIDCNSFTDPNSEFCKYAKRFFSQTLFENARAASSFFFPSFNKFFKMRIIPFDVSEFFFNSIQNVIQYRKKNNVVRNDFLQILIELMDGPGLTIEEIASQAFVFFLAGFETSSTVLMYCLLELSLNQDIQERVREEVLKCCDQELNYENVSNMVYMRQVLDEVMRKYPPIPILNRICIMDYKVPNSNLVLKKGTPVIISVRGMHHDPEYFPNPEKFDPERFSPENKNKIQPFCYLPFGEGPRVCTGTRFAYLQMKIALSILLKNYKFTFNEKTQLPLEINVNTFVYAPKNPIWVNVEAI